MDLGKMTEKHFVGNKLQPRKTCMSLLNRDRNRFSVIFSWSSYKVQFGHLNNPPLLWSSSLALWLNNFGPMENIDLDVGFRSSVLVSSI